MLWFKRIAGQMIIPFGLIVLSILMIWQWPFLTGKLGDTEKTRAFLNILPVLPYSVYFLGVLMGWRYNNTGLILTSIALCLIYPCTTFFLADKGNIVADVVSFLFPFNLVSYSFVSKKRLFSLAGGFLIGLILLQVFCVAVLFIPDTGCILTSVSGLISVLSEKTMSITGYAARFLKSYPLACFGGLPTPSAILFFIAMVIITVRFVMHRDIIIIGYLGCLIAALLGFISEKPVPDTSVYFMAAGLILIFTNIEASFFRAYVDELTGLKGRRGLNETMANLGRKYAIAMMDIDHFKKFNDTYGHKTGDDVLKMVAEKLAKLTGGGKTFRYGGEEFTAVFPGKTIDDAIPHLERFRSDIEQSLFTVRSKGRKKSTKNERGRGGGKKQVRVTISIGVSGPDKIQTTPEKVIKSADKALYKAKKAGRNCVRA